MQQVLILGTEASLNNKIGMSLARGGYAVHIANTMAEGLRAFYRVHPDLVVLDLSADTPGFRGWEVYGRIHELSPVPVVALTAQVTGGERVAALQAGADDCLTKPFHTQELTGRIGAILRRTQEPAGETALYRHGEVTIDLNRRQALRQGRTVELTAREFALLSFFVGHAGQVLTPQQLTTAVWGSALPNRTGLLKLYIWRLRRKLEDDPAQPQMIVTERGAGYVLK